MNSKYLFCLLLLVFTIPTMLWAQNANIQQVKSFYNKAIDSKNKSQISQAALLLGEAYLAENDYTQSYQYLIEAQRNASQSGNKRVLAQTKYNLGLIEAASRRWNNAINLQLEAKKIFRYELKDKKGYAPAQMALGEAYFNLGNLDKAFEELENAVKLGNEFHLTEISIEASKYLGMLCDKKIQFYTKNLESARQAGNKTKTEEFAHALKTYQDQARLYKSLYTSLTGIKQKIGQTQQELHQKQDEIAGLLGDKEMHMDIIKEKEIEIKWVQDSLKRQELEIRNQNLELQNQQKTLEKNQLKTTLYTVLAIVMAILALGALFLFNRLRRDNKLIEQEKNKSEALLLNILPKETAEELKTKGYATPRHYGQVTVLFTDFKGFTQIAEKMTPEEIIKELDTCFGEFDRIIAQYNMEKIKTIGDAYMCAGGVPKANETNPFDAIDAALEIQEFMRRRKAERESQGEQYFELRLGINTGTVVAGVVGTSKFAYDIWGDAVNLASRMESSGEPNKINISEFTYEIVKNRYVCTYRGKVYAKNKGDVDMYFVEGKL